MVTIGKMNGEDIPELRLKVSNPLNGNGRAGPSMAAQPRQEQLNYELEHIKEFETSINSQRQHNGNARAEEQFNFTEYNKPLPQEYGNY